MALTSAAGALRAAPHPSLNGPGPNPLGARASYLAYRAGAEIARVVPGAVAQPAARVIGQALALAMPGRRRQVERNLRRASGGALQGLALRKAVSETFGSYGRYWLELFRLPDDARGTLEIDIEGYEHVRAGIERR